MDTAELNRYFRKVPADQRNELQTFHELHPMRRLRIGDTDWEYIACGREGPPLLVLPGGARYADVWFKLIGRLEADFRMVVPTIPTVATMREIVTGLVGILDAEGIQRTALLGTSLGGCIAQIFVRQYPELVDRVVFSHTTVPDQIKTGLIKLTLKIARHYPLAGLRLSSRFNIMKLMNPPKAERALWNAYWKEKYSAVTDREGFINPAMVMVDFAESYTFSPDDLKGWPGRILILESDNDPAFKPATREAVRSMYPQARVHTFIGAGHTPGYRQPDEYVSVVTAFLREGDDHRAAG